MRYLSDGYSDICRPIGFHSSILIGVDDQIQRLGQRIRELRTGKGWSQEAFADVCGVHRTYMGHLERGEKNLSFRSIVRVADALDVTLAELFAGLDGNQAAANPTRISTRIQPKARMKRAGVNRDRILKELAVLERAVSALRETVQDAPSGRDRPVPSRSTRRGQR